MASNPNDLGRRTISEKNLPQTNTIPFLGRIFLVSVAIALAIYGFNNFALWLAIIVDVHRVITLAINKIFYSKIRTDAFFTLKIKILTEVYLLVATIIIGWLAITNFSTIPDYNWQIIAAFALLILGVKIFLQMRETGQGFDQKAIRDNFFWVLLILSAFISNLFERADIFAASLGSIYLIFISFNKLNTILEIYKNETLQKIPTDESSIKAEIQKIKEESKTPTVVAAKDSEITSAESTDENKSKPTEEKVLEKPKPTGPKIEVYDLSDEITERLKRIAKVKYIHNTLVCSINSQDIVSLTLVVDNNTNQEELYEIRRKTKKVLKKLDFARSSVEIEYEAEYKGLI